MPVTVIGAGTGRPVVVSVNDPGEPATKVAVAGLVIAGFWSTTSWNVWVAVPDALAAEIPSG